MQRDAVGDSRDERKDLSALKFDERFKMFHFPGMILIKEGEFL